MVEEGGTSSEAEETAESVEVSAPAKKESKGGEKAAEKSKKVIAPAKAVEVKESGAAAQKAKATPEPKPMEETLVEPDVDALSENIDEASMTEESMTVQLSSENILTDEISNIGDKLKSAFKKGLSRQMSKELPSFHHAKPSFGKFPSRGDDKNLI